MLPPDPEDAHEAAGISGCSGWRGGGMAAHGARAATRADAAHRRADGGRRERFGISDPPRGVPGGTSETRVDGGTKHPRRLSLGGARRRVDATIREGTRRPAA